VSVSPGGHNHPSLARERTAFAWERTALSLLVLVALAIRAVVVTDDRWAVLPAAALGAAAGVGLLVSRRGAHRTPAADERAIARDVSALVAVVASCGVAAAGLVVVLVADAA